MKRRYVIGLVCAAILAAITAVPLGLPSSSGSVEAPIARSAATASASADASGLAGADDEPTTAGSGDQAGEQSGGAIGETTTSGGMTCEDGVVLVGLQDGVTAADLNARLADLDYITTKNVTDEDLEPGYVALDLAYGISVEDAAARIEAEDLVAMSQPNYIYHVLDSDFTSPTASASLIASIVTQVASINDPDASKQWALDAVKAYKAWENVTTDKTVTVAVIDNGFLTTHEDLKNNIAATYNSVDNNADASNFDSTVKNYEHGTHVAGIVAAEANNSKGVAGVSYNAQLVLVKAFFREGDEAVATSATLCNAYDFLLSKASDYNIKVVNMSLGAAGDSVGEGDELFIGKVSRATKAGILTVSAAGNDAKKYHGAYSNFPSDWLEDTLTAIALTNETSPYSRAYFSNYSSVVKESNKKAKYISAPGVNIRSAFATSNTAYDSMDGTSMASPCVAGIAALLFALDSDLTPSDAIDILCSTAQDLNESANIDGTAFDYETGWGLVNADAAVAKVLGDRTSLRGAAVSLSTATYVYTGLACTPAVVVKLGDTELQKDRDFTVTYSNNVNAGTATITVKGMGNYAGRTSKQFTIVPKAVTPSTKLSSNRFVYNGSVKRPTVTVKVEGKTLSSAGYAVSWSSGCRAVGKHTVRVTLKGNYSGSGIATFTIVPKATKITKVTNLKKGFTAKWSKQAVQTNGYELQYSLKKNFTSKKTVAIGKTKTTSKKVTKLKAKKKYYVRVRTFKKVNGVKYYSSWSSAKSVKTK